MKKIGPIGRIVLCATIAERGSKENCQVSVNPIITSSTKATC